MYSREKKLKREEGMTEDTKLATLEILMEVTRKVRRTSNRGSRDYKEERKRVSRSSAKRRTESRVESINLKWVKAEIRHFDKKHF